MEETNHLEHLSRLQDVRQWQPWSRTLAEVADNLGVDPSRGLDHLEAFNRLGHFGPNIPVELSHNLGFFRVLAEEITEPMMLLLLSVGVLYSIWGEGWDAAAIFIAITLVIGLEVLTEWRAKTTLASLLNSVPTNTSVLRDGRERVVSAEDLVPGDVLILSHGQSVPADAVVAVCHGFSVDESLLTGESVNVYKAALGSFESNAEHGNSIAGSDELQEMPPSYVCAGTTVASGRAVCVVVATGPHTEIAANIVQLMKGSRPPPTPLQRRMKKLAGSLSAIAIAICILITLVGLLKGMDWREAILMGMSLAFATIPEELPLIAKASLALGARQLARYKLLVRRLSAADALSSVSVIVTDKTGTLTRNQLIVSSILAISSDSTDAESLSVEVITPEATASSEKSAAIAAPLYAAWSLSVDPLEAKPLAHHAFRFRDGNEASASATMTAAAAAQLPEGSATLDPRGKGLKPVLPTNLIFVGAFAFFDPPQGEARPVLQECQDAGIRVIVASGDHPSTTLAVANAVGITEGHHGSINPSAVAHRLRRIISRGTYDAIGGLHSVRSPTAPTPSEIHAVTGEMIQKSLTNGTFDQLIDESNVFARVTPAQKLRLVHSLQARGEVVAFVGDGVNDSPALTRADVGICMGGNASTADVAMDSASLVILSGKFSGVVRSLREGHRLAANIDKCLVFYIACKIALVSLFAFLLLAEGVSPLTPVQVILIEMFTDLGATWTFLTERPEGIPSSCNESEASLKALGLVRGAVGGSDRSDTSGYLGFGKAADRAVAFYGFLLFAACAFPLVIPSILLPSWAVAPVAPTMTFLTWMAAHSLLGFSMRTRIVPLRVHDRHSLSSPSALASAPAAASRSLGLQPQQAVLEQQQLLTQSNKTLRSR
ncbi:hypothetical protein GGI12_003508, partial [Dipsacomyces acuminosporus]